MKKIIALSSTLCALWASDTSTALLEIQGDIDSFAKTATQTRKNITYQPHIMSVFENRELTQSGAQNLKEALMLVAGIEMSVDSVGVYNPVFRGSNPYAFGQSKMIIDGQEVNDLFFGGYTPYLSMPIELIKRVEVIRGPGAFAVGHNSYAGSIVVTTYQEQIDKPAFASQLFAGAGSYGEKRGGASYSYNKDDLAFHIDAYLLTDDKKLLYGKDILNYGAYGPANAKLSQDGYGPMQTDTASLSIFLANKNFYLKARALTYEHGTGGGRFGALTRDGNSYSTPRHTLQVGTKYSLGDTRGELKASVIKEEYGIETMAAPPGFASGGVAYKNGMYAYRKVDFESYLLENSYESVLFGGYARYGAQARWDLVGDQEIRLADRKTGVGITDYSQTFPLMKDDGFISTLGAFFDYDYDIGQNLTANIALSSEKQNKGGALIEPRVSLVYSITNDDRLKLFVSKAHRNSSFQELYIMNNPSRIGNPLLKPEIVYAYEAQYIHQFSPQNTLSLDLFYLRNYEQTNKINAKNEYANAGRSTIKGVETEWRGNFQNITAYLAHTYQWGIDQAERKLPNAASHSLKTHLIYKFDNNVWGSVAYRYSGEKSRETIDERAPAKSYSTTDISFGYKIPSIKSEIQLYVKNLFDKTFKYPSEPKTYADDYPTEGRSVYFTIRSRF